MKSEKLLQAEALPVGEELGSFTQKNQPFPSARDQNSAPASLPSCGRNHEVFVP